MEYRTGGVQNIMIQAKNTACIMIQAKNTACIMIQAKNTACIMIQAKNTACIMIQAKNTACIMIQAKKLKPPKPHRCLHPCTKLCLCTQNWIRLCACAHH